MVRHLPNHPLILPHSNDQSNYLAISCHPGSRQVIQMATFYTKVQITLTDTDVPYETDVVDTVDTEDFCRWPIV